MKTLTLIVLLSLAFATFAGVFAANITPINDGPDEVKLNWRDALKAFWLTGGGTFAALLNVTVGVGFLVQDPKWVMNLFRRRRAPTC